MALPRKILIGCLVCLALLVTPVGAQAARSRSYWLVSSTGQVFAFGKARSHGSEAGRRFRGTISGIKGTANGGGYWIVTSRTHYSFGDARHYRYRAGGLRKYKGRARPKGLRGRIVGYAVAAIRVSPGGTRGGTGTTTTSPPTADCSQATIQTSGLDSATATVPYSQTLRAGGVSGGSWSWKLISGSPPAGLSLSSGGLLWGTPAASTAGTQGTFTVEATNSLCPGDPASRRLTLAVAVPPMSITTTSLPGGTYGQPYDQTALQVTGGQPGDYQWSATGWQWSSTGLSLSASGILSGTPQSTGTYNVTFTVTDSTGATPAVSVTIPITLSYPPLQVTSPSSLGGGQATVAYAPVTFTATGGSEVAAPAQDQAGLYEWSATGLPPGLSLTTHGVLSGTPTQPGSYDPQITVTDAQGAVPPATVSYPMAIADAPLQFTTTTLTATQGQSYTGHLVVQGGQPPYTMQLVGSIPSGITFDNGTVTVSPAVTPGDHQFTIGVTDSQSNPATRQETFNMWVAPSESLPDLTVNSNATNAIWAGYVEQSSTAFTSVSGTFTVPTLQLSPQNDVMPWVGIDGYGTSDLIQAGVEAYVYPPAAPTYEAWWQTVGPTGSAQNITPQNEFNAAPGDTINVNIWQLSVGEWEITLNDTTSGQGFATQVGYTGGDTTAEWIVETPANSPVTNYGAISTFTNLQASQAGTGMLELSTNGTSPSALTSSGFSFTDLN